MVLVFRVGLKSFPVGAVRRSPLSGDGRATEGQGGVKAQVLLDYADYMPSFVHISKAKLLDARVLAMLLLKWLHRLSRASWSLSNLATMLRVSLFTYGDLHEWLHDPFRTPPVIPLPQQLELPIANVGQPTQPPKNKSGDHIPKTEDSGR